MYILNISFVFLTFTIYGTNSADLEPESSVETIIQIPQGKLEGIQQIARNRRSYAAFLGVPFGKAVRFEEAKPADGWEGTRDATEFGESCLQNHMFFKKRVVGSEDCLFLNIYTANPKYNSTLHPVMVFIHGGAFQFGSGSTYDGKYFLSEDVVLVSINYRLGPFGFLKISDGANLGMKDQVLALKWVQQNIEYFGGDPSSVTIFGESAGAMSVSLHLLSPLSKGLFHRAISQSGVANSPFTLVSDPARELRKLGVLMDCPVSNLDYLIQCLKKIDGKYMLKRISRTAKISTSTNKTKEFRPEDIPKFLLSVDSESSGSVFLPDTPLNLMRKGEISKVPWINGVNAIDGLLFNRGRDLKDVSRKSWNSKDGADLLFDDPECNELATIRQYYVGGDNNDSVEVSANVTDLFSDRIFNHPAKVASILRAKYAPSYLYYFALKGTSSIVGDLNPSDEKGLKRPTHADEMQYQFKIANLVPEINADSKYYQFSEHFVKLWVTFAKDGTVAPEKLSPAASPWIPVSNTSSVNDDIEWYQMDKKSEMIKESLIFNSRLNFWNDLLGINK